MDGHFIGGRHGRQQRDQGRIPNQRVAGQSAAAGIANRGQRAAIDAHLRAATHIADARRQGLAGNHVIIHGQTAVAHAVHHRVGAAQLILHWERCPGHQRTGDAFIAGSVPWRHLAVIAIATIRRAQVKLRQRGAVIHVVGHPELKDLPGRQIVNAAVAVHVLQRPEGLVDRVEVPDHIGRRHG